MLDLEAECISHPERDRSGAFRARMDRFNPQNQPRIMWPPTFTLVRAYLDQLGRDAGLAAAARQRVVAELDPRG